MLFKFLQKQRDIKNKQKIIHTMISSLSISSEQKKLYLNALEVLSLEDSQKLYDNLIAFIEKIEMKEINEIQKENFSTIAWMRKKEAEEKLKEMNGFSFLLHNL